MRMRALTAAAAVSMLSTLTLTACGSEDSGTASGPKDTASRASSDAPSSSDEAGSSEAGSLEATVGDGKGFASGGGSAGGTDTSTGGTRGNDGDGTGGALVSCTTKTTEVTFLASAQHATDRRPAKATVRVRNTSSSPCTLTGAATLTAKDDRHKDGSVQVDNSDAWPDAVDIPARGHVSAAVEYIDSPSDGNGKGKGKGRDSCPITASEVEIALPQDEARGVQVRTEGGEPARFTVCAPEKATLGAFER
ncbi:DUF4232 domain-containing protein [Streptomyces sp. NPDC047108]|uniref:DUF4232 domain-containing protein n=1 Tax=Streptomyces sp. NPDC047108 TaxID=3155025 RepID=UPI0033F96AFB